MAPKRSLIFLLSLLLALLALSGCKTGDDPITGPQSSGPDAQVTPVTPATTGPRQLPQGKVVQGEALKVPYILWGGDMATFFGNGGPRTI